MTRRFGPTNHSAAEREMPAVDTPLGETCGYYRCRGPIEDGDAGYVMSFVMLKGVQTIIMHRDCYLFSLGVVGVGGKPRIDHEPGSPECNCDQWKHTRGA